MKLIALALALAAASENEGMLQSAFYDFVKTYNKQYTVEEFFAKYETFKANLQRIEEHNSQKLSWTLGVNQFADLTWEEFRATYLGKVRRSRLHVNTRSFEDSSKPSLADPSLDWRTKGAVSPVRNQGQCGSCYAMTVVSAIESACYIATHNLTLLSEQYVMDCASKIGNMGCNGGYVEKSFEWLVTNPAPTEACYPYKPESGSCKKDCPPYKGCSVTGYVLLPKGNETALMDALDKQPIAIVIEADQSSFQLYTGGVMDKPCGKQLDHTSLLVGYGTDSGKQYWIIQNTWGTTWGEQGYIRMIRGKDECGLADEASYPTVKAG